MKFRSIGLAVAGAAVVVGAAAYFVLVTMHTPGPAAVDAYGFFIPNALHAVRSVAAGGKGLLWNPYQACGEPFFANISTGLLYPPHLLFLLLDLNTALHVVLIINMLIGAAGALLLAREYGLGWPAALVAAVAFELGDPMTQLTGWDPLHSGPWTWVPWAMLFCERLLRRSRRIDIVGLAIAIALALSAGFVLIIALTYQMIALRVFWELLTSRAADRWRGALAIAFALVLGPLLIAVQLVPSAEYAALSRRVQMANPERLMDYGHLSWAQTITLMTARGAPIPFLIVILVPAAAAPLVSAHRRIPAFFLLMGTFYAVLAFGNATRLFELYLHLPPGPATLRAPYRLFWVSGWCLVVLSAFGIDAILGTARTKAARPWVMPILVLGLSVGLAVVAPGGLRWTEAAGLAGIVGAAALTWWRPGIVAGGLAVIGITIGLAGSSLRWMGSFRWSLEPLSTYAETFAALRPPVGPQDRVFLITGLHSTFDLTFLAKTATVLRIPAVYDYEALMSQRLVSYLARVRDGTALPPDLFQPGDELLPGSRRRLLDAAAVRYVIAAAEKDNVPKAVPLPRVAVDAPDLHVYFNDRSLPRARFVPRIRVMSDPEALLNHLADGTEDLSVIAFAEETPPSGFVGSGGSESGSARFVRDDPEHIIIEVQAPARGFLLLADQYYPGWHAWVNGEPATILRGNYLFRLVEVPAGTSTVELVFRPRSIIVGGVISAVAMTAAVVLIVSGRRAHSLPAAV